MLDFLFVGVILGGVGIEGGSRYSCKGAVGVSYIHIVGQRKRRRGKGRKRERDDIKTKNKKEGNAKRREARL